MCNTITLFQYSQQQTCGVHAMCCNLLPSLSQCFAYRAECTPEAGMPYHSSRLVLATWASPRTAGKLLLNPNSTSPCLPPLPFFFSSSYFITSVRLNPFYSPRVFSAVSLYLFLSRSLTSGIT